MIRPGRATWTVASFCTLFLGLSSAIAVDWRDVGGLRAWYDAGGIEPRKNDGDLVTEWNDRTGNGHDLVLEGETLAAIYRESQAGGSPAVQIRRSTAFSVSEPLSLADHTLFLVYRTDTAERALFRSDRNEFTGLLLRTTGNRDEYHNGGVRPGQVVAFNTSKELGNGFGITVFARDDADGLRSWVNGEEISADTEFSPVIRVGVFFQLRFTTFAERDGAGLGIAEMMIYERFLSDPERSAITQYLSAKYDIEVSSEPAAAEPGATNATAPIPAAAATTGLAQLSTTTDANVNAAGFAVPWDLQDQIEGPFTVSEGTRIVCTRDGTRVHMSVSLPLSSTGPGANLRVLFRVNGAKYLRGEGRSGAFAKAGSIYLASAHAETVVTLGRGDYVEVLTVAAGEAGTVSIEPGGAVLIIETR